MNFKKVISVVVIFAFCSLVSFSAYPLHAQSEVPGQQETNLAKTQSQPGAIEQEGGATVHKASSFPWLIVIAGVVVVGVLLYFLVIAKTQYTLTVTLATGATGTPAAGATKYNKGTTVNYAYTAQAGYAVKVTLDGATVANSGTVTMDKDHTLAVTTAIDITGSWAVADTWGSGSDSFVIVCSGTAASGTFTMQGYLDHGTYTVSGNSAIFTFVAQPSYYTSWIVTCTIADKNTINGTYVYTYGTSSLNGSWAMTRTPPVASISSGTRVISKIVNSNN